MCTTVAIALTSLVVALIVISSNTYRHHQNAKSVTKENDASDSFWDSSHLSPEEVSVECECVGGNSNTFPNQSIAIIFSIYDYVNVPIFNAYLPHHSFFLIHID